MAPKVRRAVRGETREQRAAARATIGNLRNLLVSPQINQRYQVATAYFLLLVPLLFGHFASDLDELDQQLMLYLEVCWAEGESRSFAADTICGIQHVLSKRRCFPGAWRFYGAWTKHEAPCRAPPLPWLCVLGVIGAMIHLGRLDAAATLALCFHGFLRTGEMLQVCAGHVAFSSGTRRGVLLLPLTKSGQRAGAPESVRLDDALVGGLLSLALAGLQPHETLLRGSPREFRILWSQALVLCGIDPSLYKPYSIRRGGATQHFLEFNDLASTQHRGRWGSYRAARIYIVEGQKAGRSVLGRRDDAALPPIRRCLEVLL